MSNLRKKRLAKNIKKLTTLKAKSGLTRGETTKLLNRVRKLATKSNKRLAKTMRKNKKPIWASKELRDKLDLERYNKNNIWSKVGRININKKGLNRQDLMYIENALNDFLKSKTSTQEGIDEVKKKTIETLKNTLQSDEDFGNVTDDEVEFFYKMLEDRDFSHYANNDRGSDGWVEIKNAIDKKSSLDVFLKGWENYVTGSGANQAEIKRAKRIYNKYVKPNIKNK